MRGILPKTQHQIVDVQIKTSFNGVATPWAVAGGELYDICGDLGANRWFFYDMAHGTRGPGKHFSFGSLLLQIQHTNDNVMTEYDLFFLLNRFKTIVFENYRFCNSKFLQSGLVINTCTKLHFKDCAVVDLDGWLLSF